MAAHLQAIHMHVLSMPEAGDYDDDDLVPVDDEDLMNQLSAFAAELKMLTAA